MVDVDEDNEEEHTLRQQLRQESKRKLAENPHNDNIKKRRHHEDRVPSKEGEKRNRRMFGALVGHLGKARQSIEKDKAMLKKRDSVVSAIEEKNQLEEKRIEKVTKEKRAVGKLKQQIASILSKQEKWIQQETNKARFVQTISLPPLYYLPAKPTDDSLASIATAQEVLEEKIKTRKNENDLLIESLEQQLKELSEKLKDVEKASERKSSDQTAAEESKPSSPPKSDEAKEIPKSSETAVQGSTEDTLKQMDQKSSTKPSNIEEQIKQEPSEANAEANTKDTGEVKDQETKTKTRASSRTKASVVKDEEASESKSSKTESVEEDIKPETTVPAIIPKNLKVVELRKELKSRGLDSSGLKAALVRRLTAALKQ